MDRVVASANVIGVIFSFLDVKSLGKLAFVSKAIFERVKNYPVWSLQLDSDITLIVIDQMNAMAMWGTLDFAKSHPPEPYQVIVSGLESYPSDSSMQKRYGGRCPSTLWNLHSYKFLIEKQMMSFSVVSVPKTMSVGIFANFAHAVVIMVNTTEEDWEGRLETAWKQCDEIGDLQPIVLYCDEAVARVRVMAEIRKKGTVMKMGILTQELMQEFYGALGRICKVNKARAKFTNVLKKVEQRVAAIATKAESEKRRDKRCEIM